MKTVAITLAAVLAACADHRPPPSNDVPVQIEDSAGVRIVAYVDVPEVKPSFAIAAEPVYRHGANPGDYEFRGINVGRLFPDGSAVVSVLSNSEVVVLSPDGTTYEVLARGGQGPGDVTYVYSMFVPGQDTMLLADPRLVRLTLFVGDSIARMANLPRSSTLGVAGFSSSGEVLLANRAPSRPLAGLEAEWLAGHMIRFEAETGAIDTVASYDHMARLPPDLPWNPIAAVGEVTVAAGLFIYTRSDRPEITWRLPDGTVTQIVRWRAEPVRLTERMLEPVEVWARMENRADYPHLSESQMEEYTQMDMADYRAGIGRRLPLFGSPFADANGNVWLPSYRLAYPEEGSPYTVISSDGEWMGQVETPPRFRILDVARGLVLGVLRDEMDVENVVVYELSAMNATIAAADSKQVKWARPPLAMLLHHP